MLRAELRARLRIRSVQSMVSLSVFLRIKKRYFLRTNRRAIRGTWVAELLALQEVCA